MQYKQTSQMSPNEELAALITAANTSLNRQDLTQVTTLINKIEEDFIGEQSIDISLKFRSLLTLASYYQYKSNYSEAARNFRQALNLVNKLNEEDGDYIIDAYLKHATLEREYSQEKKARMSLAKLLFWLDKNRPEADMAYGLAYSQLGKLFFDEEDIESGIEHMKKALNCFGKHLPENHPLKVETIDAMSTAYIKMEDYDNALSLYQTQLKDTDQEKDGKTYGEILLKIGEIYFYIDLSKAHHTIIAAKEIFISLGESAEGPLLKAYLMLGELEESIKNDQQAIDYYDAALQLMKNDNQAVLMYAKLGALSIRNKQLKQAKAYLETGLPLARQLPRIRAQFLLNLGKVHTWEQELTKANTFYNDLLQLLAQEGQETSRNYLDTLKAIAINFSVQKNWPQAIAYYDEALPIYEKLSTGGHDVEKGMTYIRLAFCKDQLARDNEEMIEGYFLTGYEMMNTTNDLELKEEALAAIIAFYDRHGQAKKKAIYEDKLANL